MVAALASAVANLFGLWWVTFVAGLAVGAVAPRRSRYPVWAAGAGAAGWGLPLLLLATRGEAVTRSAQVLGGIVGLRALGAVGGILVTLLAGILLCVSGAWVGSAASRLERRTPQRPDR